MGAENARGQLCLRRSAQQGFMFSRRSAQQGFMFSRRSAQQGFMFSRRSAQQGFTLWRRSAENGFTLWRRSAEHGFTLIELLVALLIFALLSMAGVALLRSSVSAQGAVGDHLDRLADVQRTVAALDADLAQATVRISRTETGTLAPAFFSRGAQTDAPILQFVRGGWSNPEGARRSSLQKVEYWWRDGRLERVGYPQVDGATPSDPAVLLQDVGAFALRFRDLRGEWRDDWTPAQPGLMPRLVEMVVTRAGRPAITLRFVVGPGEQEQPQPQEAPGA